MDPPRRGTDGLHLFFAFSGWYYWQTQTYGARVLANRTIQPIIGGGKPTFHIRLPVRSRQTKPPRRKIEIERKIERQ